MIEEKILRDAKEAINILLLGAQLDSLRVFSSVIDINFLRLPKVKNVPTSVWLSVTSQVQFWPSSTQVTNVIKASGDDDFFQSRKKALVDIYSVIGNTVTAIDIDPSGVLELYFDVGTLSLAGDPADLEEIWSITSDTPEPYGNQDWAITLTDQRELVTRRPPPV